MPGDRPGSAGSLAVLGGTLRRAAHLARPAAGGHPPRRHRTADRRRRHLRVLQGRHRRARWRGASSSRCRTCGSPRSRSRRASSCRSSRSSAGPCRTAAPRTGRAPGRRARCCSLGVLLAGVVLRGDPDRQPGHHQQLLRRRLGDARRAGDWRSSPTPRPTSPAAICSGHGRFRSYAIVIGSDGVMRIVLCVAARRDRRQDRRRRTASPWPLSPLVGVLWRRPRGRLRTDPGPEAAWKRGHPEPRLAAARLGVRRRPAQRRPGRRQPARRATREDELVTRFGYGVLLARIPLFLFQAVQAALLPRLSRLAARGELDEFRGGFRKLMQIVVAVGVVGTSGAFVLGPFVVEKMYDADLSRRTLAMLALGSALYMVGLATRPGRHRPARPRARRARLGHRRGHVPARSPGCRATMLFRRIEIGLVVSSIAALICVRARPAQPAAQRASCPTPDR